jgi:adenine-specific DNA-methyltransferase
MIGRHTVYVVDQYALVACFESGIDEQLIREIARWQPLRAVFRDSSFVSDAVKINTAQIFAQLSPMTDVRVL